MVTVNRTYYGWSYPELGCKNMPVMITRSDSMIADNGYCMFLNGGEIIYPEEPFPAPFEHNVTQFIIIKAKIRLVDGNPVFGNLN